jgi:ABC-2 type transport system ATP-binding protein
MSCGEGKPRKRRFSSNTFSYLTSVMIEVQHLTKRYGDLTAVSDISFTVASGQILGFLGPNGSGKTTTMRVITGFMPASSGTVKVAGFDIFDESFEARKRIGYLPESPPLYNDMTVTAYLRFVARIKGMRKTDIPAALDRALTRCGLTKVTDRVTGHLSKGFRQRVGLAQAIIHNPEVLVLDEPTVGLDPQQIIEIRALIRELAGQHTVVLSTHILPEVAQVCEKVVIINAGRVVMEDMIENLTRSQTLEEVFLKAISQDEPQTHGQRSEVGEVEP